MEERITKRITELKQSEREAIMQLTVIKNLLAELESLLQPQPSGAPLGEQTP